LGLLDSVFGGSSDREMDMELGLEVRERGTRVRIRRGWLWMNAWIVRGRRLDELGMRVGLL
jgi:hypothetical protein